MPPTRSGVRPVEEEALPQTAASSETLKDSLDRIVEELVRQGVTMAQARQAFERQFICAAIEASEGNLGRAARAIGVHRNTLRNKISQLGISTEPSSPRRLDRGRR